MREYLKSLEPEEVIDRLNNGERVYYEDTRGKKYSYKVYKGMTIRYNEDGEVDGYNRSIYSTGEAYFETEGTLHVRVQHHYQDRLGNICYVTGKEGSWYYGQQFNKIQGVRAASWTEEGEYYEGETNDYDLIKELD